RLERPLPRVDGRRARRVRPPRARPRPRQSERRSSRATPREVPLPPGLGAALPGWTSVRTILAGRTLRLPAAAWPFREHVRYLGSPDSRLWLNTFEFQEEGLLWISDSSNTSSTWP